MERICRYCSHKFAVGRDWQLFCGATCRIKYHRENLGCFYCGQRANARDHIVPCSVKNNGRRFFDDQEYVRVCEECNTALSNLLFDSLVDRVRHVSQRMYAKYGLHAIAVHWNDDELSELGPALRRRIQKKLALRAKREARYQYAKAMEQLLAAEEIIELFG